MRSRAAGGRPAWLLLFGGLLATLPCGAQAYDLTGYLQEAIAVDQHGNNDILYHRQLINAELSDSPSDTVFVLAAVDLWRDDPDFQKEATLRGRIREGYLKLRFADLDLRIGRIQVAWGESDAIIVSDQVTPFDYTNFIVPRYDEIRMGVDGIEADYYFNSGDDLQLLWLTRFRPPDYPDLESPWSFVDPAALAAAGFTLVEPDQPAWTLANSEYGARYSGHPVFMDWSVGYLRSWDDRPVLLVFPTASTVVPAYHRFDLYTFNLAYPLSDYLLRVDSAYERGRYLSTFDAADPTNPAALPTAPAGFVSKEDVWRTLVGVDLKPDISWWEQADLSLQLVHEQVMHPHPALAEPKRSDLLVIIAQAAYRHETIKPWLLTVLDTRGANCWIQTKIDYEPFDDWRFSIEYDTFMGHGFDGENGGRFGMFTDNDMFLTSVRYSY